MRLFNNTNASLILAIFNNLGSKNERVSASTENAPVYNVMQKEFPTIEISKYKICSSNDGGQSTIQQLKFTDCNYEEDANSTHNTMSIQ